MIALQFLKRLALIRDWKMLLLPVIAIFLSLTFSPTGLGQVSNGDPTIYVAVTAIDKNRKLVETLRTEDFRLKESGVPQAITGLNRIKGRSLSLTILIDTSLSQEKTLGGLQFTAKLFLTSTIQPGRDQAAVATFAEAFTVEQKLTDDLRLLQIAIERAQIQSPADYIGSRIVVAPAPLPKGSVTPVGSTGIWDSLVQTCEEVLSDSSRESSRAIILLSDGNDTSSKRMMDDAIKAAAKENVAIYSIGIGDRNFYGVNKNVLRSLSESTGGRAFFPKIVDELTVIFTEIREALRNQYILSYSQSPNPKPRKLHIEIVNPGLKDVKLSIPESF